MTVKQAIWLWIKHSPVLTVITTFIVTNLITIILHGGFSMVGLLANLFPTVFAYFLSAMYNERRKLYVGKDNGRFDA